MRATKARITQKIAPVSERTTKAQQLPRKQHLSLCDSAARLFSGLHSVKLRGNPRANNDPEAEISDRKFNAIIKERAKKRSRHKVRIALGSIKY